MILHENSGLVSEVMRNATPDLLREELLSIGLRCV